MKQFYKELKATVIIGLIVSVLFLASYFLNKLPLKSGIFIFLLAYVAIRIVFGVIESRVKNKGFSKFVSIFSWPLGILYAILLVTIPFIGLVIHVLFYFAFAFMIPELIYIGAKYFHLIDSIKNPTALYLRITSFVFVAVILNPALKEIVCYLSPFRPKSSDKMKPYEMEKTIEYTLSINNIRFFVYGSYVLALLVINFFTLQGESINKSNEIDKAVLQSFVTFIAFDRALALMKTLNFSPSALLNKIGQSIINKVNDVSKDETP